MTASLLTEKPNPKVWWDLSSSSFGTRELTESAVGVVVHSAEYAEVFHGPGELDVDEVRRLAAPDTITLNP